MPVNVSPAYKLNTPPYTTERHAGALWSIASRQFRFCAWEPLAKTPLEAGVFVTMETDALNINRVKHVTAAGDKIFGVTFLNTQRLLSWDSTLQVFKYAAEDVVSLIEEGDIFMYAEVPVLPGDLVFTRVAADAGLSRLGALNKAAGTGLVAVPGAKFLKNSTAPGLVPVSLTDLF